MGGYTGYSKGKHVKYRRVGDTIRINLKRIKNFNGSPVSLSLAALQSQLIRVFRRKSRWKKRRRDSREPTPQVLSCKVNAKRSARRDLFLERKILFRLFFLFFSFFFCPAHLEIKKRSHNHPTKVKLPRRKRKRRGKIAAKRGARVEKKTRSYLFYINFVKKMSGNDPSLRLFPCGTRASPCTQNQHTHSQNPSPIPPHSHVYVVLSKNAN